MMDSPVNVSGNPPRILAPESSLLLVVDIQEKFSDAIEDFERVVARSRVMIQACALLGVPVLVSEQYPKGLGHTVEALRSVLPPDAVVLEKAAFGCGRDEGIMNTIRSLARPQIMLCGLEAHVCVNQTAHQLLNENWQVHLLQDAVASRHKKDAKTGIAKMLQSGAIPSCVEMALFELMGTARHEQFKPIQNLIK